jgi:hypothetical protein
MAKEIFCFCCSKYKQPDQMIRSQFRRIRCKTCDDKARAAKVLDNTKRKLGEQHV